MGRKLSILGFENKVVGTAFFPSLPQLSFGGSSLHYLLYSLHKFSSLCSASLLTTYPRTYQWKRYLKYLGESSKKWQQWGKRYE